MPNIGDIVYEKSSNGSIIVGMITNEGNKYTYLHFFPNYPEQEKGYHLIGMSIFGCAGDDIIIPAPIKEKNDLVIGIVDDFIPKKE